MTEQQRIELENLCRKMVGWFDNPDITEEGMRLDMQYASNVIFLINAIQDMKNILEIKET